MKKVISYTLYGNNEKYTSGAIINCEMVKQYYPGWQARYYVGKTVNDEIVQALIKLGAEIIKVDIKEDASASLWRFLIFCDFSVDAAILRDTDSTITKREVAAVQEWLDSGKSYHIMRDHPHHSSLMLAGLWGAKSEKLRNIKELIDEYLPEKYNWGIDQEFLSDIIYPKTKGDVIVHDSFFFFEKHKRVPYKRKGYEFVGEALDESERIQQRAVIKKFKSNKYKMFKHHTKEYLRYYNLI